MLVRLRGIFHSMNSSGIVDSRDVSVREAENIEPGDNSIDSVANMAFN